ncbi:hypothetical protein [Ancylobacter sp. IITR112]|uniref:hypothetical protein n=1 Tax=Ancylobacter sp. IITR112 TaxID=3138073 RepID=UPI00352B3D42
MDILIGTNHLVEMAGSELICLEMAEYFARRGHRLTLFANVAGKPMAELFRSRLGLRIITEPRVIAPFSYDLVYFQHQVAGLFDYRVDAASRERSAFVFGRLGRRSFMESGGWTHDRLLANACFANSDATAEALNGLGLSTPITTFYNSAPSAFFRPAPPATRRLRKITVITNHLDPTLKVALDRLALDLKVEHIGRQSVQRRVTPELIGGCDLVVSIGKTVPYALVARVPVYVYDHFGGPGYLTDSTFARAAWFNFSGRCCERRLEPAELARELVEGYPAADGFARRLENAALERYRLEPYLDAMLATPPTSNAARVQRLAADPMVRQERLLAVYVREQTFGAIHYRAHKPFRVAMALIKALKASRRWRRSMVRKARYRVARLRQSFSA